MIGAGSRSSEIVEVISKRCVKVNRVPLLKCFTVLNDLEKFKKISIEKDRKFYVYDVDSGIDGVLNRIFDLYEIFEGILVITTLNDDFSYNTSIEICKKLKEQFDEYVTILAILPRKIENTTLIRSRLRDLKRVSDIIILFSDTPDLAMKLSEILNLITLAGEIDLRKKVIGEIVIDSSDIFNALKFDGFSVVGYSKRNIPFFSRIFGGDSLKAIRTNRIVEMTSEALNNLSVEGNISDAKSALLLFAGNPNEIVTDGIFASISLVERLNKDILIRYGDYPLTKSKLYLVLVLSGVRSIRFK